MGEYVYPVRENARGTNAGLYSEWNSLEKHVFETRVKTLLNGLDNVVLDIGAGEGKYSLFVAPYASELIVVEPDKYRLEKAKKRLRRYRSKKTFLAEAGEQLQLPDRSVDIALSVHVIQHITEANASKTFSSISKTLKPGGLLVLFFSDNSEYSDEFHVSWKKDDKPQIADVPESIFELLTQTAHEGALQYRSIQPSSVIAELEKLNFSVEVNEGYMPVYPKIPLKLVGLLARRIKNPVRQHKILHSLGYNHYIDRCVVARKLGKP